MFVTSNDFPTDLQTTGGAGSGLAGGDSFCNTVANAVSLGGTWKVLLSTSNTRSIDRFTFTGPWTQLGGDGGIIFETLEQVALLTPSQPINRTESGALLTQGLVWTGTTTGGGTTGNDCNGWTSSSSGYDGTYGLVATSLATWLDGSTTGCSSTLRLYCFER